MGAYQHTTSKGVVYHLHTKNVLLRGGTPQTIYFFTKSESGTKGEPADLPANMTVTENPRNGFLTLKKKLRTSHEPREVLDLAPPDERPSTLILDVDADANVTPVVVDDAPTDLMSPSGEIFVIQSSLFVAGGRFSVACQELGELIRDPATSEGDLQQLLEEYPELAQWDWHTDVRPHIVLELEEDRTLIPDFVIRAPDGFWDILEIKPPSLMPLVVRITPSRVQLSRRMQAAIEQAREYARVLDQPSVRHRVEERYGIRMASPRVHLIVGRTDPRTPHGPRRARLLANEVDVRTWDEQHALLKARFRV